MAKSLAPTRYMCKYHIVFIPKFRRKVIYNKLRKDIQKYFHDARSCSFASTDTSKNECFLCDGVSKRKKQSNDI